MKYYAVDETGTPIASTPVKSSQYSYLHQVNTPLKLLQDAINEQVYGDPYSANSATKQLKDSVVKAPSGLVGSSSGGSGGGGSGGGGSGGSPFVVQDGKVKFKDATLDQVMQMINQTAEANNMWSAEQAQKQMDFQKMMSDTAHQREVVDLKAAGLNPVLSAGGQGATVTSGAMGQVDDSNTRLIADLAMVALEAIGNTAVGVAGAGGASRYKLPYALNRFVNSLSSGAGFSVGRSIVNAIFR